MDEETIKQIKSIVREAVSEAFDAKMTVLQLRQECENMASAAAERQALYKRIRELQLGRELVRELWGDIDDT